MAKVLISMVKSLAVATLISLTMVAIIELALRNWLPFPLTSRTTYQKFDDILFFHKPNSEGWEISPIGEFDPVPLKYNSGGYRGVWNKVPINKKSIVVIGDSFIEARQVPEEQSLVGLLNSKSSLSFFVNAGCSAYTSTNYFLLMKHRLLNLEPQLALVFISFNDYRDNYVYSGGFYKHPELFTDKPAKSLIPDHWDTRNSSLEEKLILHSALYTYIKKWFGTSQLGEKLSLPGELYFYDHISMVNKEAHKFNSTELEVLKFTHRGLRELVNLNRQNNIQTQFFIIPTPMQIDSNEWVTGKTHFFGFKPSQLDTSTNYQKRILDLCEELNVTCHDLLPVLQQAKGNSSDKMYFDYDGHWTPAAQKIIASYIQNLREF